MSCLRFLSMLDKYAKRIMCREILFVCFAFTHLGESSRLIKTARELYQRSEGLDLLSYMFAAQPMYSENERSFVVPISLNNSTTASSTSTTTTETLTSQSRDDSAQKVSNSVEADIRDFPYVASLQLRFNGTWYFVCGGSLVARNKVLTAAHCIVGYPPGIPYRVIVGSNVYFTRPHDQIIDVIKAYIHPYFDITRRGGRRGLYAHDVAILKLARDAELSDKVQPIQLAERGRGFVGQRCTLAGYGISNPNDPVPSRLQSARMTVISTRECQKLVDRSRLVRSKVYIYDLHVCTVDSGTVPCMGDSGSALVCDGKAYGVYSFGDTSCAAGSGLPRGFMKVTWYLPFLQHLIAL